MPQLVGLNFYMAIQALQAAGIYIPLPVYAFEPSTIIVEWAQSSPYAPGIIFAQYPAAGDPVTDGQDIVLSVSRFPFGSTIDMPPDWRQRT